MHRYKLTLAYDGTAFHGWQKQQPIDPDAPPPLEGQDPVRLNLRTVQHIVEQALRRVVREPIVLTGASRTDAGVHAGGSFPDGSPGGQVAAFTSVPDPSKGCGWPPDRGLDKLMRAVNGNLPHDVKVLAIEQVPLDFQPISGAVSKAYSYCLHVGQSRPLWDRAFVCHTWHTLDAEQMHAAAAHLVGQHDFAAFAAVSHGRATTTRTIHACSVTDLGKHGDASRIRIDVSGNGFLYNMVRIIAGTLVDVGRGKLSPDDIPTILESKQRQAAGSTMPPQGLRLEWIRYD